MEFQASLIALCVLALMLLPVLASRLFALRAQEEIDPRSEFLTNEGGNGLVATLAGAVAGNIGIGSFLALFLFANQAPVIAFSVVGAYSLGLLLCAVMAPLIRRRAEANEAVGLVDLMARTHRTERLIWIWIPMAFVFVLRSAVQLGALGLIAAPVFGNAPSLAIVASAVFIAGYLLLGGYRAAVQTDIVQAGLIVICGAVLALGLPSLEGDAAPFLSFGQYEPAILVGIWLFIPWSALLAVDNWQRITIAGSTRVAQTSYAMAALVCGSLLLLMAYAGYWAPDGADMYGTFTLLAPTGMAWIATIMFVACIMSSIDTFIMPLVSTVDRSMPMRRIRLVIMTLVGLTALTAIFFSDTLDTIIAAFNSLAVFLPAAFGTLFLRAPRAKAAIGSMYVGLISVITLSSVSQSVASLVGFALAAVVYVALNLQEDGR